MSATLELAKALIARPSVTPEDCGCQSMISERLVPHGFSMEPMNSGKVNNVWLRRGDQAPLLVFAGHTDVVPPGPDTSWSSAPFEPSIREGRLYGRGAADMKSSIAAMTVACENFVRTHPEHSGSIALLLTSDEEGPAVDGTAKVIEQLQARGEHIDWCIVGEPTSSKTAGDTLKIGRRGSLSATLHIAGIQGHVAYPLAARNPIHDFAPALAELVSIDWDAGNEHFPATSLQVSNIHAGTGASNVIPGTLKVDFNVRFSTETSSETIQDRVREVLDHHGLDHAVEWHLSGNPFYCRPGRLVQACEKAVQDIVLLKPELSTSGGTSDGRFIAPTGAQVVELGPVNESIHKVNEHIDLSELEQLERIYEAVLQELLV
ncbi:MAG: succinyl-diaminopimelate desuccinylase [Gammaproteobacteria bacterium]|nr:succinyl-diaminopimelate desuccinylase [Gammaproteobacteria bacterium]MDE0411635.1 succinyl-diaminopimelate desuccinylase [Gammaproteobacteria bacterium]